MWTRGTVAAVGARAALGAVDDWPVGAAAVGVVNRSGVPATTGPPDRPFRLASVTKLLTAMATLVAVEEGTIGLDEAAGPPGATIRHLLAHASGLPFEGVDPVVGPGVRRIYSNTGFEVLAAAVSERAGFGFDDYVREAVLGPLGMWRTTLAGSAAAGTTRSCLADLLAFATELLNPTIVARATLAGATEVAFPGLAGVLPGFGRQAPNDWGLGLEIRGEKSPHWTGLRNSPATFGHFGAAGTFLWVDPAAQLACVGLADREFGPWAMRAWPALADAVLDQFA